MTAIVLILSMLAFTACSEAESSEGNADSGIVPLQTYEYSANDLNDSWNEDELTATVTLDDDSTKVSGTGASFSDGILTVDSAGTYLIEGKLTDGQITVAAGEKDDVHIVLNGVNVTNADGPAFYEKNADKVVLTLATDSLNTFSDGNDYANTGDSDPDAAIYGTHDLSINGSGTLNVNGNYNNGIGSQDDLAIVGSTMTVKAKNNAIKGRDVLAVKDGILTVTSDKDGLKSNNDTDKTKGYIQIDSGTIDINVVNDGIQAETNLIINGGEINATTTGTNSGGTITDSGTSESMKALKAVSQIAIRDGSFKLDAADDAVHANGNVTVDGGTFEISTADDAFHADYATVINDGTIKINACYEGIEGQTVEINGGDIDIVSSDDAINAAGGSADDAGGSTDDETTDADIDSDADAGANSGNTDPGATRDKGHGPNGADNFGGDEANNANNHVKITGGVIEILAGSDGLDSNGDLIIEGGKITISTPSSGVEGTIDANGDILFNGGDISASGVSQMAQSPSDESEQNTLIIAATSNFAKDTPIYLLDSSGSVVAEHTPKNDAQLIIMSRPDIKEGEMYSVCTGSDKTKLFEVTISQANTIVDENGQATQLRGMGGGQPGGTGSSGSAQSGDSSSSDGSSGDGNRSQDGQKPSRQPGSGESGGPVTDQDGDNLNNGAVDV